MSTTPSIATTSTNPRIQGTVTGTPPKPTWQNLADDPFRIVALYTSLIDMASLVQTSKDTRKRVYKYEAAKYLQYPSIVSVHRNILAPSMKNTETPVRIFYQRKTELILHVRNREGIFGSSEKLELVNLHSPKATFDDYCQRHQSISDKEAAAWISRFNWLSSTYLEKDADAQTFAASLKNLNSPAEKAAAIRTWITNRIADNQLNLNDDWMEAVASKHLWAPSEFLDIPTNGDSLSWFFQNAVNTGSFDFIKRVIESDLFGKVNRKALGQAFYYACSNEDAGIATLILHSNRFHELNCYNSYDRIRSSSKHNTQFGRKLLSQMPLESLKNLILDYSERVSYLCDWRPGLNQMDRSQTIHNWAPFIDLLSPKRLEQLFALLCNETNDPELRKFLLHLLNHPRMVELKTSVVAKGLFTATGGEAIARTASAAMAYYLGTHMDMLPAPVASLSTASFGVGAIAGVTKEKVVSAWKSIYGTLTSLTVLSGKAIVIRRLLAELKQRTPLRTKFRTNT